MSKVHEQLKRQAMEAIRKLFSDASVDKKQTAVDLQELVDEIEVMQDSLFA